MHPEPWAQVKALFRAVLEESPDDRAAFLARRCDDEMVRAEVAQLLRVHDQPSEFLEPPVDAAKQTGMPVGVDRLSGHRLGDFVVLRRIGAGGMGEVYEAQQDSPNRRAAVKVLRSGYVTQSALKRLEYEAEVLARLRHPGIANVFAAGTFDLGDGPQPWFAMELIEGAPLHRYVRDHSLSVREKLDILLKVCDAVQHAHQQGVIHRDLKPANILIVQQDAECVPKVLDFGVARVTDAEARVTMHTSAGELVGTLSYMSPEQLSGDPNRVDSRSDVYALGVIGYELLAGQLPLNSRGSSVTEIIRALEYSDARRLGAVAPTLSGDLDVIFAKALEKEPLRRYQSATELAADLRRFLNDEPVLARPATAIYQLRKFARRNRALVGGVTATIVALAAGLVLYAIEAGAARREAARSRYEADKATVINNFMTNDFLMKLLAAANAGNGRERLPVGELVDQAAENVDDMFGGQPLAEAAVRNEVGTVYYNLGSFEKAADQFRIALERWEAQLGPNHADTLKAVNNLGQSLAHLRRGEEAEALYRRAVEGRRRTLGEDDPFTLVSMNNLAQHLHATGRLDEAEAMMRQALKGQRRVHGDTHKNTLTTTANLGTLLLRRGQTGEALRLHREVYVGTCKTLGEDHLTALVAGSRFAQTLLRNGAVDEAEAVMSGVMGGFERVLGADHRDIITPRRVLARIFKAQGRTEAANEQLHLAIDTAKAQPGGGGHWVRQLLSELQDPPKSAPDENEALGSPSVEAP